MASWLRSQPHLSRGRGVCARPKALQVYSAQHQNLTAAWVDAFSAETGIRVQVRKGQDASMGHQIVAEGDASPADVFITENSPAMTLVERAGLLAEVDGAPASSYLRHLTLSSHAWVPIAARSTVLVYNTTSLAKPDIPAIFDGAPTRAGRTAGAARPAERTSRPSSQE